MNLINKKLKDKLKVLDDIDKQYIIKGKNKNNNTTKNNNRINNINSLEMLKKATNEHFDKIYSNFILNENSYYYHNGGLNGNYSMSNNNLEKVPTNEDSIEKEKNNDLIINYDKEPKNQNETGNEIGQRLINYGMYLQNKLDNQRKIQENKIKQLMKPKINTRANSNINPEKISERLYHNFKKNIGTNKKNNKNISNNDKSFSYHPKINKKSLLIAEKLEPSFVRLNKKKNVKNSKESDAKKYYINLFGKKTNMKNDISFFYNNNNKNNNNNNKKHNSKNNDIYKKMNNLYLRGVEQKQKKEKIYNEHQKMIEEEYKNYSFKPEINKNKNIYNINDDSNKNKNNSKKESNNIYKKNFEWKKKIEKKINKDKEKKDEIINKLCTFTPEISEFKHQDNNNNSKFISNIRIQMDEYVNKRRQNIKYKKIEEKYRNKRLGGEAHEFTIKTTIPHEFKLETDKRNRYINKNKNRSCENFHLKKINFLLDQNSNKKSINNEDDKNYWFFKEDNSYCYSHNNTRGSNKIDETQSQIDFVAAVSALHDKLGKLNI